MSADAFELLALTARYVFVALMLLIVLRAARGALVDSRRAARLRRLSPMTGLSGELVVLDPLPKIPRGMHYPVIREGMIGSSGRADVRIRDASVRRRHALFELTERGLHIRTHASSRLRDGAGNPARELTLADGDSFTLGGVHLLLVLSVPDLTHKPRKTSYVHDNEPDDELFDIDAWEEDRRAETSDPISPIFDAPAPDPYDDDLPLYARPREERAQQLRRSGHRPAPGGSDDISPIFAPEKYAPDDPLAQPRRPKKREFLSDDELFGVDNDKF